jgi:hypothetical protein
MAEGCRRQPSRGGFSGPNGTHRVAQGGSGGNVDGDGIGLAVLLAIVAVFVLSVAILSRVGTQRATRRREAKGTRRRPARAAS